MEILENEVKIDEILPESSQKAAAYYSPTFLADAFGNILPTSAFESGVFTASEFLKAITLNKNYIFYAFESVTGWETAIGGVGALITPQAGRLVLKSGDAVGSITRISALWSGLSTFKKGTTDANPLIQCQAIISNAATPSGDGSFFIGYGDSTPFAPTAVIGFEWNFTDGKLYAVTRFDAAPSIKTDIGSGIDVTRRHFYKIVVSGLGRSVKFFVDAILKFESISSTFSIDSDYGPTVAVRTETINQRPDLIVANLFVSQDF